MLPTSSDPMAPGRVPRHAAGTPDGPQAVEDAQAFDARGRHRRPESLADTLRQPSEPPSPAGPVRPSASSGWADLVPVAPVEPVRPSPPGDAPPRSGWTDLVPSSPRPDAAPAEPPSWSAYLPQSDTGWGGSWASELGSTGSWQSGDVLPEPGSAPAEIAPEGHTATADSRDAWAFESTGEWLLSARRFRRPLAAGERAGTHPADAAIAAARSAAARLHQDRPPTATDDVTGHHERTAEPDRRITGRHGREYADRDDRPAGGAHRAPEPKRAPAWSRITGSLPILGRATAPADDAPAPRRGRAGRRRRAAESASPQESASDPFAGPPAGTATDDSDVSGPSGGIGSGRLGAAAPVPTGRRGPTPRSAGRRAAGSGGRRAAARPGKHAHPADPLAITVRPAPAVLDVLQEGRRAAGAVREWALWTADRAPAGGTHRAPGTLPLESWLLIGRSRQQALLAALVAAGLALVLIPVQRATDGVDPVTASGQSAVVAEPGRKGATKQPPAEEPQSGRRGTAEKPAETPRGQKPKPDTSAPGAEPTGQPPATTEPAVTPPVALPPGDGPARSLRLTGTQAVALTFDDGPDPVHTPRILAMLEEHGVTATFCLVGDQVRRHPDVVRQIVAAGHTLCNHSWDHSFTLGKQHPDAIRADLERTNQAIRAAVPDAKIPFFRAPGGNFTDRLVEVAYAGGMASLYWEVDPRDWERAEDADSPAHVRKIVDDVRASVRPGSIVLSHDFNQPDTIAAYAELLPWLRDNFELGVPTVPPPVTPDVSASAPPPAP